MHTHIYTCAFTVALKNLLGWLGCRCFAAGITIPRYVPLRDAPGDRVTTGRKNIAMSRVSADFRHNGARVSRQAFLAN